MLQICNVIYINGIHKLGGRGTFRTGDIWERNTLKRKCLHFDEIFITGCTESCQNECSQWWKFHQNDDIFVSVYVVLMLPPFLRCAFMNRVDFILITTWMLYMFRMHIWDNQNLEKYCRYVTMKAICRGGGGGGHFQNGGCLRMYYTVLRMSPFSRCTISDRLFFINKWMFHMFRMHVLGNHKVEEKYSRYAMWYANEIHTLGYSQNGFTIPVVNICMHPKNLQHKCPIYQDYYRNQALNGESIIR